MKELELTLELLESKNINVMDLDILQEINYQTKYYLEVELTDKEKEEIFSLIHRAYLKSEGLPIHAITTAALDNIKELATMTTKELIERTSEIY